MALTVAASNCTAFPPPPDAGGAERKPENAKEEDGEEVFTVELQTGPHGLGLALVDGMVRIERRRGRRSRGSDLDCLGSALIRRQKSLVELLRSAAGGQSDQGSEPALKACPVAPAGVLEI